MSGISPGHDLSRRAAYAVHTGWFIDHVGIFSPLHDRFNQAVDDAAHAGTGWAGLAPEFQAIILRCEGKSREADALSYPKRPQDQS